MHNHNQPAWKIKAVGRGIGGTPGYAFGGRATKRDQLQRQTSRRPPSGLLRGTHILLREISYNASISSCEKGSHVGSSHFGSRQFGTSPQYHPLACTFAIGARR